MASAGRPPGAALAAESSDSEDDSGSTRQFKVILLGDGAVGKTSIAHRFASDVFGKVYKQTIGVDFFLRRIELPGGITATLQTWDIGGQTIGSKMLRSYIYGAQAVLLCYDVTSHASFDDLEDWLREAQAAVPEGGVAPLYALVGNKTDMGHLRAVKPQRHKEFADAGGMASFFVSAKTGDNVSAMFYRLAADLSGVELTKPDLAAASKVVAAALINHPQHDPEVQAPPVGAAAAAAAAAAAGDKGDSKKSGKCAIQ